MPGAGLLEALHEGRIVIVAGFQGVSYEGGGLQRLRGGGFDRTADALGLLLV